MRHLKEVVTVLASMVLLTSLGATGLGGRGERATAKDEVNRESFMKELCASLKATGKAGRVYFRGTCQGGDKLRICFPRVVLHPQLRGPANAKAIRRMFRNDEKVSVSGGRSQIVRIRIGKVPTALLETQLSLLQFSREAQYDPIWAIYEVQNAGEVKSAMQNLRMKPIPIYRGLLSIAITPETPHLPSVMKDVTVDQALDTIATTFHGVVLYGSCERPSGAGLCYIGFANVENGDLAGLGSGLIFQRSGPE